MSTVLSTQNINKIYRDLDETGVAISVAGTSREKLMELARMTLTIIESLVGIRPEISRARNDLLIAAHNVRHSPIKAKIASKAVKDLANKIKSIQKLIDLGFSNVSEVFSIDGMILVNEWGYTEKEIRPFVGLLKKAIVFLDKIGLSKVIYSATIILRPDLYPNASMTYDLFSDVFGADPLYPRERMRGISDAIGGRLWILLFNKRDVEVWGGVSRAWDVFSDAFFRLLKGKALGGDNVSRMASSLGSVIGPDKWKQLVSGRV